jgi:hypothetical protein
VPHLEELESRLVPAGPFLVNSTADLPVLNLGSGTALASNTGTITLRSAIMEADVSPGQTTIVVPAGTYALTLGPLTIGDAVSTIILQGAGANQTVIDAGGQKGSALIVPEGNVSISGVHVEGGTANGSNGGGIRAGTLAPGAPITLTLRDVWISSNQASLAGGPGGLGGGLFLGTTTTADIENSTISGNTADTGGGIYLAGKLTLINSTISGNQATGKLGGGLFVTPTGSAVLINDTIAENKASIGAGMLNVGVITLGNTLLAANTGGNFAGDGLIDLGNNLDSDGSAGLVKATDLLADPLLGPLQFNGGTTPTRLPGAGSPAIDAGASTLVAVNKGPNLVPTTDQRGFVRTAGPAVDIGAVEVQPAVPAPAAGASTPPSGGDPPSGGPPPIDPSLAVAIFTAPAAPGSSGTTFFTPAVPGPSILDAFPGGRPFAFIAFTSSGGGDVPVTLVAEHPALAEGGPQTSAALPRDEKSFGSSNALFAPTLTQLLSQSQRDLQDPSAPVGQPRARKARVGEMDLALQMVRPELKAIQMAESIFDGDDLVQQFAQFVRPVTAAPVVNHVAEKPMVPPILEVAPVQPSTEAAAPAESGHLWRFLFVPGTALVGALIWLAVAHRRVRKASCSPAPLSAGHHTHSPPTTTRR